MVLILIAPLYALVTFLLSKLCCCSSRVKICAQNKVKSTFFNGIFSFVEAEMLLLTSSANINIYQVINGSIDINLSFYFACVTQVVILLIFIGLIFYLMRNV